MCGVRITFGSPRSTDTNSSPADRGSSGKTSTAAPARCPETRWRRSASWSITKPRHRFRNSAPGRIRLNSFSPNSELLDGRPSTCKVTISEISRSSSRLTQRRAFPSVSLSAVSWKTTRIPSASPTTDSCAPIFPYPTIPSVRPRTSWAPRADLSHTPACIPRSFSVSRRVSTTISARVSSTTLRVFE